MGLNIVKILSRRDTEANWAAANPILSPGELGYEIDTGVWKMGDGVTPWLELVGPATYEELNEVLGDAVLAQAAAETARDAALDAAASVGSQSLPTGTLHVAALAVAAGDGVSDDTAAFTAAMVPGKAALIFTPAAEYLAHGHLLDGNLYEGFFRTHLICPSGRMSTYDDATREWIDSEGRIWRLKLRVEGLQKLVDLPHKWDATRLAQAIDAGAVTITVVGTSIPEGAVSQAEPRNAWVNRLLDRLRLAFPAVTFTLHNLALAKDDEIFGELPKTAPATNTALNNAQPVADLIDEIEAEMLDDWEEVMGDLVEPLEDVIAEATSYEEALEKLNAAIPGMRDNRLINTLVKGMFKARSMGDTDTGLQGDD